MNATPDNINKRIDYFDILRAVAIIGVVSIHASSGYIESSNDNISLVRGMYLIFNKLTRFCVPLFFMISGALFLDCKKDISIKTMYSKYIRRIVVAFVLFSFCYALVGYFWGNGIEKGSLHSAVSNFIVGHYHMWFLFAIAGLYILTPILRYITIDRKVTVYYLIIAGVVSSIAPAIMSFVPSSMTQSTNSILTDVSLALPRWSFYYVLGYALHAYRPKVSTAVLMTVCCSIAIIIIALGFMFVQKEAYRYICWDYTSPMIVCYSSCIFLLLQNSTLKLTMAIKSISECSFGIYLVHVLFLIIFANISVLEVINHVWWGIPIKVVAVFVCSLYLTKLIRLIPVMKKIL